MSLPPGWEARWDPNYRRYYYLNHATKTTTWARPAAQPRVEQIPMQDYPYRKPFFPASSSQSTPLTRETGFQSSSQRQNSEEEDMWRNVDELVNTMRNNNRTALSINEKVNVKQRFKHEFRALKSADVERVVEQNNYDEDVIRATLASLRDVELETQRRKQEEVQKQKEEQRRMEIEKMKREMKAKKEAEMKAKKEAERKAKIEAEMKAKKEAEMKAKIEAEMKAKKEAEMKAKREAEMKAKREAEMKAKREAEMKAKKEAEMKAKIEAEKKVRVKVGVRHTTQQITGGNTTTSRQTDVTAAESNGVYTSRAPLDKKVYISPNRIQPVGPQASLRNGPDLKNLTRDVITPVRGPNRALVSGPQSCNVRGSSRVKVKQAIHNGPQSCLRQGPQCRTVNGYKANDVSSQSSGLMNAVVSF